MEHLTKPELLKLLAAARDHSERDFCLLLITFWHGLRASEALTLTPRHLRDGHLAVKRLKGSLPSSQPLVSHPEPLLDERAALLKFAHGKPSRSRLFDITRQRFGQLFHDYCALVSIKLPYKHAGPHVLKHTCAKLLLAAGADIPTVQRHLGHKSGASTLMYLRVTEREAAQALRNAVSEGKL